MPRYLIARYRDIRVGQPNIDSDMTLVSTTPHECRLRDITYRFACPQLSHFHASAPIYVDIEHTKGEDILLTKNVVIGRLPIMLKSKVPSRVF